MEYVRICKQLFKIDKLNYIHKKKFFQITGKTDAARAYSRQ